MHITLTILTVVTIIVLVTMMIAIVTITIIIAVQGVAMVSKNASRSLPIASRTPARSSHASARLSCTPMRTAHARGGPSVDADGFSGAKSHSSRARVYFWPPNYLGARRRRAPVGGARIDAPRQRAPDGGSGSAIGHNQRIRRVGARGLPARSAPQDNALELWPI